MLTSERDVRRSAQHIDDFWKLDTAIWTDTNDGATGAVAVSTTAGAAGCGILSNATAAATNDYHVHFGPKVLEALADRAFRAAIRFKITESSSNSSHWAFGVSSVVTGGFMTDTTGVPLSSYAGACFYKPAGAAVVAVQSANATTKTTNASAATFVSGAWTELVIEFDPGNGTTGRFRFDFNGVNASVANVKIPKHNITLSGLTPMGVFFGVKASGGAAETQLVDVCGWEIARA